MNINEVKEKIRTGIEIERAKTNRKYNKDSEDLNLVNNVPEAIKQLVNIYGNSLEQRELMIEILSKYLKADFFQKADVIKGGNHVFFNDGVHSVAFSTSRVYEIVISKIESTLEPRNKVSPVKQEIKDFLMLWDHYQETGEDFRVVVNAYSKIINKSRAGLMFIFRVNITDEIEDFANERKIQIEKVEEQILQYEIMLEKHNKGVENFKVFKEEIKEDLANFENSGWTIKYN